MAVDHRHLIAQKAFSNRLHIAALRLRARLLGRHPVAILLTERLGDLMACEPVAREVKRTDPKAFVAWFCDRRFAELVRAFPGVDAVVPVVCITEVTQIEPLLGGWKVIDLHINGKECGQCRIPKHRADGNASINVENYFNYGTLQEAYTRAAQFEVLDRAPSLPLPVKTRKAINRLKLPEAFAVLHCRSEETAKNWEPSRWRHLALELQQEHGLSIVEVGSAASGYLPDGNGVRSLCGKLSILESAEVIRRSRLFVGVDSGPAHLANAVRAPGVILIGRYRIFRHYTPYNGFYGSESDGAIVIQHWEEAPFIPYHKVSAAVRAVLKGSPSDRQEVARRLRELPNEITLIAAKLSSSIAPGAEIDVSSQPAEGNIDTRIRRKDGSLFVSGWGVVPEARPRPADALLLVLRNSDGRLVIQKSMDTSHDARPDVAQLRQDPNVSFSGWHWLIPAELLAGGGPLQLALYDAWLDRAYLLGPLHAGE